MRTRPIRFSSDPVPSPRHQPNPLGDTFARGGHIPVLLHEVIELLDIQSDDVIVDATLGGAGHARVLAEKLSEKGVFVGFDLDNDAIERAKAALAQTKPHVHLINANFRTLGAALVARDVPTITKALFDLGWSSYQLGAGKGFSFLKDEPLSMTYGTGEGALTAGEIVNRWEEESIADIVYGWGEERYARKIAKAIAERRDTKPFSTARELAEKIKSAVPASYRHGRIHPATRTFQALRIAVNDELGALEEGLQSAWHVLEKGGRIAVISFQSLEDRIVKRAFLERVKAGEGRLVVKKPVTASREEISRNPRARSAKLRVIEKTAAGCQLSDSSFQGNQI